MSAEMPWTDWRVALATALACLPPGPPASRQERLDCVCDLRRAAAQATALVAEAARLPEGDERIPELIADRAGIVRANIATVRHMVGLLDLAAPAPTGPAGRFAGAARGYMVGTVLAHLAGRVLGQFDAFGPAPRLMLVAPSVMAAERKLGAVPRDFRTWVCLHEQTHRVQFANAPWLVGWFRARLRELVEADGQGHPLRELQARLATIRRDADQSRAWSTRVVDATASPRVVAVLDRMTAAMSLLEGHADVMMDRAGPQVVPSLAAIRRDFDRRRARRGPGALLGRLVGMDAKLAQYRDGAGFCRAVISSGRDEPEGIDRLNMVFSSERNLPGIEEILHPQRWIDRVATAAD